MVYAINNGRRTIEIRDSAPESTAAILLGIMETPEEQDFKAILTILREAARQATVPTEAHELKSILRGVSEMFLDRYASDYAEKQGLALQMGVRRLLEFGEGSFDRYSSYNQNLKELFIEKGIIVK